MNIWLWIGTIRHETCCIICLFLSLFLSLITKLTTTGKLRQLDLIVRVVQSSRVDAQPGRQWHRPPHWLAHNRWPTHVQQVFVVVARSLPLHSIYESACALAHRAHITGLQAATAATTAPVRVVSLLLLFFLKINMNTKKINYKPRTRGLLNLNLYFFLPSLRAWSPVSKVKEIFVWFIFDGPFRLPMRPRSVKRYRRRHYPNFSLVWSFFV